MRRRQFIALASTSPAIVLPIAARGQQPAGRVPLVGFLANLPNSLPSRAFRAGLGGIDYAEGQNIHIESRFFEGRFDRLPVFAAELTGLKPDVIVVIGAVEARAAKSATNSIPVIFAIVPDPVAAGLVANASRPGGNLTGITSFDPQQPRQQLALLKELLPNLKRLAIIGDQAVPNTLFKMNEAEAISLDLQTQLLRLQGANPDLEAAFNAAKQQKADALLVLEHPSTDIHRREIAELATRDRLPTMFPPDFVDATWTGLIAYGTSLAEAARQVPAVVDKILKGANPGEIPITVASRIELILNLKTAKALAIDIPASIRKRANNVIE